MRALVTGASGFTGGYMVQNLFQHGHRVRVFVRTMSNIEKLKTMPVEFAFGQLQNKEEIASAMQDIDVVFHLAALYRAANLPDSAYWETNVMGTENVMEAALKNGVKRVVHCSTGGVHGHIEDPPADEDTPFSPGDVYQDSKLEAEKIAFYYQREKGLPVTVVRPIGIYGPGDLRMLKMYRLIQDRKFIMFGDGNALYHLTYVTDAVEGFRLAAEAEKAVGKAYIIGGERYITLNQFAEIIAAELNVAPPAMHFPVWPLYVAGFVCEKVCIPLRLQPPIFRRRVDIFTKDRAFDISKAKRELGYQPKIDMEEGIHLTAQWYVNNGHLKS
ncbi:hypothetical protein A2V82_06735 [candidate division KSB1 bacterium RBG_16_48_16]|nr:MAG: hypothetical protein A2V82_06735 [candidate division KSB1 bacterium RBG_16_48_16]